MQKENNVNRNAIFLSLCNLNLLGLGYLLVGLKKRWAMAMGGILVLLILGLVLNASIYPILWAAIFTAAFIGMAVDLWLLIWKDNGLIPEKLTANALTLPLAAVGINLVLLGAFFGYRAVGNALLAKGEAAYTQDDFQSAYRNLFAATRLGRLSLNMSLPLSEPIYDETRLLAKVQDLSDKGEAERALETAQEFYKHYRNSPKTSFMNDLVIDQNLAMASDFLDEGNYEDCLKCLDDIQTKYPDEAVQRQEDIQKINLRLSEFLARDSGSEGAAIIEQARQIACEMIEVMDPAVDIFPEEPGKAAFCYNSLGIEMPAEILADIPGTFRYVVDIVPADQFVSSCDYYGTSGKRVLQRWTQGVTVIVRSVRDEEDVTFQTFYGSSPSTCPLQYTFMSNTQKMYGDPVDESVVKEWLLSVVE